jgi:tetratricopeptide (TPR) repeat protein
MNCNRLPVVFLLIALCGAAAFAQSPARVWEAPLTLPTYELGPPDPNPPLFDRSRTRGRPSYPYPLLDSLTNKRVDKTYRAVFLENEYLRVTVLPELGGKLYAIYDKTAGRDVLYTNHVVKYAMVGIRGAWTSGGIEWNFPDGHTLTTVSPVDYVTRVEEDGSAAVIVGDTERVQRMQWAVAIRLRPGRKVVETEVTLNNRRETPGRYWFWATAAAPATEDMRFIYPMREAYPHAFWPVFSFPKHNGVDLSSYREVTNYLSLFARDSRRDFFGVYYEKSDWGIAHVANHHELPGKKTWTWGTDDAGKIWIDKLTDNDGQYVEFQAGRFETQMEHEFIAPHRVERFTEYWFPLDKLGGGFSKVTKDVALRVEVTGDQARITANASAKFDDAELFIAASGKRIHSSLINLSPETPFATTVKLPAPMVIVVRIRAKDGRELVHYYTDSPPDGNPDFKPATRPNSGAPDPAIASAERFYLAGLAADKKSDDLAARAAYNEALKLDPGYAPAHTALGLSFYRSGEYDRAAEHLEAALRRNRDDGDAHYYLGLTRRAQDRVGDAIEQLMWCVRAGYRESVARYVLGEMDLASNTIGGALEQLSQAVRLDPRDLKARTVLAVAERRAGRLDAAQARIDEVVREAPLDYFALHEQYKILEARKQEAQAKLVRTELWFLLSREPDSLLELMFDYAAVGGSEEAIAIAIMGSRGFHEKVYRQNGLTPHPMLMYLLSSFLRQIDSPHRVDEMAIQPVTSAAAKADPAYVFPHRVEEITVLQTALKARPTDGRAAYYLGNALASKLRFKEALEAWRIAVQFDSKNALAHRNYARALALVEDRKEEAAATMERAIALAPDDYHLYLELDRLLSGMKQTDRRIKLLEGAPEKIRAGAALSQALAAAYVDAGRFAEAVALLERHTFTSGEGEGAALGIYSRAHLAMAGQHQQAGRHAEAAAEFIKATEYPPNFGVGRPAMESQAREYVAAALEFEAAGRRDEAEKWLRRAAEDPLNSPTQPEEPWSEHYYYKAVALNRLGRRDDARALYERLARLNDEQQMQSAEPSPPRGALRFLLAGWGLKALGRNEEAREAFQHALQLDPANDRAQAELNKPSH